MPLCDGHYATVCHWVSCTMPLGSERGALGTLNRIELAEFEKVRLAKQRVLSENYQLTIAVESDYR